MGLLYGIGTLAFSILEFITFIMRISDWADDYEDTKFRTIFRVYDLFMIIFPFSIAVSLFVIVVGSIITYFESPRKFKQIKAISFLTKSIFK